MARRNRSAAAPAVFGIKSARDFYTMVIADFDDFMAEQHSGRRAIHCAISAYHLHDWVWGERLAHNAALRARLECGDTKDEFIGWLCKRTWHFLIVQEIATGLKHFRPSSGMEIMKVQTTPFAFGAPGAGWGGGAWGVTQGHDYLLIDVGPSDPVHQYQPAAHVLEAVVRFWRDLFRALDEGAEDVPFSAHHVD